MPEPKENIRITEMHEKRVSANLDAHDTVSAPQPQNIRENNNQLISRSAPIEATAVTDVYSRQLIAGDEFPPGMSGFPDNSLQSVLGSEGLLSRQDLSTLDMLPLATQENNDGALDQNFDAAPEPTGRSSLLGLMADLDRTVRRGTDLSTSGGRTTMSREGPTPPQWGPRAEHEVQIRNAEAAVRENNGALFRTSLDTFFRYISPHQLMINENEFRSYFNDFVFNDGAGMTLFDRQQFLILVFLVHAETMMLDGYCSDPSIVLGWKEFCIADKLLCRSLWFGKGNVLTLSILVSKARFLLYMEKLNSAHDTMSGAVRLCFQLSLHNQTLWQDLDPFGKLMRQHAFWSIFQLDRSIASTLGLPHMIRDTDFNVDLPPPLDDRGVFPGRSLPAEIPEQSSMPYMYGVVRLANLHAEIWNATFGVKAIKPTNSDACRNFDQAINMLLHELPPHLQWDCKQYDRQAGLPSFLRRQRLSLYLVC